MCVRVGVREREREREREKIEAQKMGRSREGEEWKNCWNTDHQQTTQGQLEKERKYQRI